MQTQDAPAEIIFKLWPWLEANKKGLIGGLLAIIAVSGIVYFISAQRAQKEVEAGRAVKEAPKSLAALFRPSVQPYLISMFKHDPAKLAAGVSAEIIHVDSGFNAVVGGMTPQAAAE